MAPSLDQQKAELLKQLAELEQKIENPESLYAAPGPEEAPPSGSPAAGPEAMTSVTENGGGEYVDNFQDWKGKQTEISTSLSYGSDKFWKRLQGGDASVENYELRIPKAAKDAWRDYKLFHDDERLQEIDTQYRQNIKKKGMKKADAENETKKNEIGWQKITDDYQKEDDAIELELKLMADNQILLLQNERCLLLNMPMRTSGEIEVISENIDESKKEIVFNKTYPKLQGHHDLQKYKCDKVYGFGDKEVQPENQCKFFQNIMFYACTPGGFKFKPIPSQTAKEKEQKAVFAADWDGEEIVYGDEMVWDSMTESEKEIARLRGKVLDRNGILKLGTGDVEAYFNSWSLDQKVELKKFYFEKYKSETTEEERKAAGINHDGDYYNKVVLSNKSKYARKTIFGHLWRLLVKRFDVDVLMSESLEYISLHSFAALLLNRLNDAGDSIKDNYGFIVEKEGLKLIASNFDYNRWSTLTQQIYAGEVEKNQNHAEHVDEYKQEISEMLKRGVISPTYVDENILKKMIENIKQDKDNRYIYHYWKTFIEYYAQQLKQCMSDGTQKWNQGV